MNFILKNFVREASVSVGPSARPYPPHLPGHLATGLSSCSKLTIVSSCNKLTIVSLCSKQTMLALLSCQPHRAERSDHVGIVGYWFSCANMANICASAALPGRAAMLARADICGSCGSCFHPFSVAGQIYVRVYPIPITSHNIYTFFQDIT